ncbi:MAG: choice-of-anchor B family protein [Gemmatimonadetes bacterium]|nr:choice-of-anchor B family protein [Gemmatimonadota bacterium]
MCNPPRFATLVSVFARLLAAASLPLAALIVLAPEVSAQLPDPPSGCDAAGCEPSLSITWTDNASNEDGYRVWIDDSLYCETGPDAQMCFATGLAEGSYVCAIAAFNGAGQSVACSLIANVWTFTPPAPENCAATDTGSNNVVITWDDTGEGEAGFIVYRGGLTICDLPPNSTSCIDVDPPPGAYTYEVFAYTPCGISAGSSDTGVLQGPRLNMTLLGQKDEYGGRYSDIWGYVDSAGNEYAIMGHENGTIFYDLADPANPQQVGYIAGPNSDWRDVKTYANHAYIVTEGAGAGTGLQIVDLADPQNPVLVNTWDAEFTTAHNIFIDTTRALGYACGSPVGTHVFSLSDPVNPVQTALWNASINYYIHDLYVFDDTIYAGGISDNQMHIIANPNDSTLIEAASWTYAGANPHAGWLLGDKRYFAGVDETGGGRLRIWDIADKQNIVQVSQYQSGGATSIHNVFVRDDIAYISYYTEGVRVVDVSDPAAPVEIGYYDTYLGGGPALYAGNWGVYPFLPSGLVIASDIDLGLHVIRFDLLESVDVPSYVPEASGRLAWNAPNPFNPATTIVYFAERGDPVELAVYDLRGRLVRSLVNGTARESGMQRIPWDGTDDRGRAVASGKYFYRLRGHGFAETKSMLLVR